jgi:hypothetical protein
MTHKVLIDYDERGWADKKNEKIRKDYEEIKRVGEEPNPKMGASDEEIAIFCEENNCDLLTADKKAYTDMLKNKRVKAVQISKYDWDDSGNKWVYLIKIL